MAQESQDREDDIKTATQIMELSGVGWDEEVDPVLIYVANDRQHAVPRYGESVQSAWQIIDKLVERGWGVVMTCMCLGSWTCNLHNDNADIDAYGETPQAAIVAAALKTIADAEYRSKDDDEDKRE